MMSEHVKPDSMKKRAQWRQYIPAALVVCVGIGVSLLIFVQAREWELAVRW